MCTPTAQDSAEEECLNLKDDSQRAGVMMPDTACECWEQSLVLASDEPGLPREAREPTLFIGYRLRNTPIDRWAI